MKVKTLAVALGVYAPLILSGSASGAFLGVQCCTKPNEFGILAVNVYAVFDRPGEDLMQAIAGTANAPQMIQVIDGTFYNHQFGTDRAPLTALVDAFPSLAFDSFVTVGVKQVGPGGQPVDNMTITPGFPGVQGTALNTSTSGWAITPNEPAADPFNPDFFAGDGRVLIGQFSTADGSAIQGTMLLRYVSNGNVESTIQSFYCDATQVECTGDICQALPFHPDCNNNGIRDSCDIQDGTSQDFNNDGIPDECQCISDINGDGEVGMLDFLKLLGDWAEGACQ